MRIGLFLLAVLANQPSLSQTSLQWVNGTGSNGFDGGFAVAVDSMDQTYVGGFFVGTVDFDPGPDVFELTATIEDPLLARYDSAGDFVWARNLAGRGKITDIVVDASDNVVVLGEFVNSLIVDPTLTLTAVQNRDVFWAKFDSGGNFLWGRSLGGNGEDLPQRMVLDSADNIIISGTIGGSADLDPGPGVFEVDAGISEDSFVAKYDGNGDFAWGTLFKQTTASGIAVSDSAQGLAVGDMDSVFVGGLYQGSVMFDPTTTLDANGADAYIAKLNSSGVLQWVLSTESSGLRTEHFALGLDLAGNIYAAGMYIGAPDFDPDPIDQALGDSNGTLNIYLASYDDGGDFRWVSLITGDSTVELFDLHVRDDGASTIAGQFSGTVDFDPGVGTEPRSALARSDAYFAHYDPAGALISAQHLEGTFTFGGEQSGIESIAPAPGGRIAAAGTYRLGVDFDPGPGEQRLVSIVSSPDIFVARFGDPPPEDIFKDGFEEPAPGTPAE